MASSAAIRAGKAFVELATNNALLVRGLDDAAKRVRAFGQMMAKASLALTAAGGGLLAPIAKAFKESFNRASDVKTLSDRFGMTAEKVSAMAYAFERGGSSLDEFASSMDNFQAAMFGAANQQTATFDQLFLNARNMAKLPIDKQFDIVLSRVNRLANPMDRARIGAELFGGEWAKLSNTTLKSAESLRALEEEAARVGAVISTEDAERGQKITLALTEAWQALKYAILEVGTQLLPQADNIGDLAGQIREAAGMARQWIQDNRGLVLIIAAVGAGLVAAGVTLGVFSTACGVASTACGVLAVAVKLVVATVGFLLSPIGLCVAAVAGLTVAWMTLTESGRKFASEFGALFRGLGEVFSETWGGIAAAIASGDLSLALKIAGAGLRAAWATVMTYLTEAWVAFKNTVVDGWHWVMDRLRAGVAVLKAGVTWVTHGEEAARKQLDDEVQQIVREREAQDAANKAFRDRQIADARADEAKARAELAALTNRARAQAAAKQGGEAGKGGERSPSIDANGKAIAGQHRLAEPATLYAAAKGTFASIGGGSLKQSLGYGDNVGQRILETNRKQLGALGAIREAIEKKTGLVWK